MVQQTSAEAATPPPPEQAYVFPSSFAQRRLWFLQQLEPDQTSYLVPIAWHLSGLLDVAAANFAINRIVQRHDTMRTSFAVEGNEPLQVVSPYHPFTVAVEDLSGASDPSAAAREAALAEANTPIQLNVSGLFRCRILRLAPTEHVLLFTTHHIIFDGWSKGVWIREFSTYYSEYVSGKPSRVDELPIQYGDFASWQHEHLSGKVLDDQLAFWKNALDGAPTLLELPTDRPRPTLQSHDGAIIPFSIDKELSADLRRFCRETNSTLFMVLITALQVLLSRYSGQQDVLVGTPIANRERLELEPLIGFFSNTLVMRGSIREGMNFLDLLVEAKRFTLDAYAHQDMPFEKLVEHLQPERSLRYTPLFQVMFALQNTPRESPALPGLTISGVNAGRLKSKFDLHVFVVDDPAGLRGLFEYSTALFDQSTIERFADHYRRLLAGIIASPGTDVALLPLMAEPERKMLLVDFNSTTADRVDTPLHQIVAAQVKRTPDAIAVRFENKQLSYRELDGRANQLAHYLVAHGVRPGALVGVCAERSLEMVIALLGVQKAGAAYVPIDPEYPPARLESVIEDADPPVLLTQEHLLPILPAALPPVLCLDRDWKSIAEFFVTAPDVSVTAKDVAYAIYTSGSTGKPKGVPNVHEGIVNRLCWMQHQYGLTPADRVLQKTPYSFDVSVWEFFWPLMQGACIVMARPQGHKDPDYLVRTIRVEKITTMHFVPSMLRVFLESPGVEACTSLKRVMCSGEALTGDVVERFFERLPNVELHNLYGPTEAAVDVTYFECKPELKLANVPIGRPVWNTQIHILSASGQLQPIGVPGELNIAGVQLARGYLNRPELTAERFVPNPFSNDPEARMYRTGDLCRWLADGTIEYYGRLDHQVKIRGFRIELGEIEATLRQHTAISDCVVMAREDNPGDKRLVAYIVSESEVDSAELRTLLKKTLPDYMVPSAFVTLQKMPLTSSGKVDRKGLPAPAVFGAPEAEGHAPRTRMEALLSEIWKDILKIPAANIEDDFFQLGGHSLLAAAMITKLSESLGYRVPLATLFEAPTLGALAAAAERQGLEEQRISTIVPVRKTGTKPALFCVSRPNVNALGFIFLSRAVSKNLPVYGLQSHMENDGRLAPFTLKEYEEKATEYIIAMREVQPEGPYFLTGFCEGAHIAFEMARQLEAMHLEVGILSILDVWPVENTVDRKKYALRSYGRIFQQFMKSTNRERIGMVLRKLHRLPAVQPQRPVVEGRILEVVAEHDHHARKLLDQRVANRYWPGKDFKPTMYNGNAVIFRVAKQPFYHIKDEALGWRERIRGKLEVVHVPGTHNLILREPGVTVVARELEALIDNYLARKAAKSESEQ